MSAAEGSITSALLKSFAEGLASNAGGQIGALLFGSIFPGGNAPIDLNALCDRIKSIIQDAIVQNDIDIIKGHVTDAIRNIHDTYADMKGKPSQYSMQQLFDYLKTYVDNLSDDVSRFEANPDWAQAGFPVYLLTVNIYLSLLQERALVDPDAKDSAGNHDPWRSAYKDSTSQTATSRAAFAQGQWATLQANRKAAVTVEQSDHINIVPMGGVVGDNCWRWKDSATGDTGDKHCGGHDGQDNANADCAARQQQVQAQLVSDMGDPDSVIAQWQKVAAVPLPSVAKVLSLTGTWMGNILTLAWQTTGAASITLYVSNPHPIHGVIAENDFNQDLTVEATGTRNFVFTDITEFEFARLTCTDAHGVQMSATRTKWDFI